MTHIWAVVLGITQGIAEFLPISSTAHLKLLPWVFGLSDPVLSSTAFDVALHAGSFVAILIALWRDWADLVLAAVGRTPSPAVSSSPLADGTLTQTPFARRFIGFLLLTSVPAAVIGFLFESKVEKYSTPDIAGAAAASAEVPTFHYAPLVLGIALIVFGVLLWAVDKYVRRKEPLEQITWVRALLIGLAQALALVPGVSRSGATMTAGRLVGLEREAVARYSFMAALPIIGGAAVFGLRHEHLTTLLSLDWILGFTAAAVSSVLVMRWMLSYVRDHSFALFMWYRIALGLLVVALFFARG